MSCLSVGEPEVWRVHVWSFPRLGFILSLISGTSNSSGGYLLRCWIFCQLLPAPRMTTASQVSLCCTKWWWQSYAENRRPICSNPHYTDYIWIWIKNDQRSKTWNCLISTSTAVNGCSSLNICFLRWTPCLPVQVSLEPLYCQGRYSLCSFQPSARLWMGFLSEYPWTSWTHNCSQVIQSCETIWGCIKIKLAIFGGMNIHLPVIWGSLGYQGFDSYPFMKQICPRKNRL